MNPIITTRLQLIPLTAEQLALAAAGWPALEADLGLVPSGHTLSPPEQRAIASKLRKLEADPAALPWLTYWLLVIREEGRAAGMCGFKGAPLAGEVEVGYGTFPASQGRGYMTEALAALVAWARAAKPTLRILAETDPGNAASRRVLEKVGFRPLPERAGAESVWFTFSP